MNRNVVITGAGGFIGKYLVQAFLKEGDWVCSVVRNKSSLDFDDLLNQDHHFIIESTLEDLSADNFPRRCYDVFFHLAWHGVNRDEIDSLHIHEQNFSNANKCLEICDALCCRCFLDVGSRAEYGLISGKYEELLDCLPLNAYGQQKYRFYRHAFKYCAERKIDYIHFRIFSVIGKGDHPWSLISSACSHLKHGEPMYMGACEQIWNFMDVRDAVEAMIAVLECILHIPPDDNRIINIASNDTRILRSFIEEIRIITKSNSQLVFDVNKKSEDVIPDISKLTALTDFKTKYTFTDTVNKILEE